MNLTFYNGYHQTYASLTAGMDTVENLHLFPTLNLAMLPTVVDTLNNILCPRNSTRGLCEVCYSNITPTNRTKLAATEAIVILNNLNSGIPDQFDLQLYLAPKISFERNYISELDKPPCFTQELKVSVKLLIPPKKPIFKIEDDKGQVTVKTENPTLVLSQHLLTSHSMPDVTVRPFALKLNCRENELIDGIYAIRNKLLGNT